MSLSPLFLSLLPVLAPQQPSEMPPGLPLPTLRPLPYYLEELADGQEQIDSAQLWHAAQPHAALLRSDDFDFARARRDRAEALADLNGWSSEERDSWLAATAPRPVGLRFEVIQDGEAVAVAEQPILPGAPVTLGQASSMALVHDFQVEIAQTASVADPEMRPAFTGMQVGVLVLPVADRGWWIELAFASSEVDSSDGAIDLGAEGMDGKRRDARRVVEFSGALLLAPNEQGAVQLPGGLQLRLSLNDAPGPGQQAAGRAIRVDVPTLSLDPGMQGMLEDFESAIVWADPSGLLLLDADTGARAASEFLRAAAAAPSVSIGVRSAQGEQDSEVLLALRGLSGRDYHFASGLASDAVVDWDVEVASAARIADPVFHRMFAGWAGSVGAELMMGEVLESRCFIEHTSLSMSHGQDLVLASPIPGSGDGVGLPGLYGRVDQIKRTALPFRFRGPLASCKISTRSGTGADGARSLEMNVSASSE